MAALPIDIITDEILPRLPAKSILRFKAVSKSFEFIIGTDYFIRKHVRHSRSSDRRLLLVGKHCRRIYTASLDSPGSSAVRLQFPDSIIGKGCGVLFVISSLNGLVCLAMSGGYRDDSPAPASPLAATMGCAFVKQTSIGESALDSHSPAPENPRRRRTTSLTLGRQVPIEKRKEKEKLRRHSSNSSQFELQQHIIDSCGPTNEHGWPNWLADVVGDAINHFTPRRAATFQKLDKIGQGTYSNVYKARDLVTGKIVALKKVRFDKSEPEGVKFMAREILILCRLDHPNVIKLQGLVTSRMSSSVYLVFDYMEHDLAGLSACLGDAKFTEPQVKCFVKQLFSGLEHCHNNGVLHRDIKGSNLLIDNEGILKIADFGLATLYDPNKKRPLTSRVVTLWYRPPELLLGATHYGVAVDLWSAGCILAELLAGKPIMPGRTEVEQLHKIFKLCGSPSEEYWKKYKLPNATLFKPQQSYKRCILETFTDFPPSSLPLIDKLLCIDLEARGNATDALSSEFFTTEPYACEPSSLPKYPPSKEMDVRLRGEATRRQKCISGKANATEVRRGRIPYRAGRAIPVPEANAELQSNLNRMRQVTQANAKNKSEKFPPPHQDGAVGVPSNNGPFSLCSSKHSLDVSQCDLKLSKSIRSIVPSEGTSRMMGNRREPELPPTWKFFHAWKPSTIGQNHGSNVQGGKANV